MQDRLHETAVANELQSKWLGRQYTFLPSIGSTNAYLTALLRGKTAVPHGAVVVTDYQTHGKGRLGRSWTAPPGTSLLCSLFLRPDWPGDRATWLTMMAGLAAIDAVTAVTDLSPALKWPNDLMLYTVGTWRKTGGILLEATLADDGRLRHAIVGIGINVNITRQGLPPTATPATSLLLAGGRPVPRRPLLLTLLQQMEHYYAAAERGESPHTAWTQRLITTGQSVTVTAVGTKQTISGVAEGTDRAGRLQVRDANGRLHTIAAGDVTLRTHTCNR